MDIPLRAPCSRCDSEIGVLVTKSGQDVVFCSGCNQFQYNAPKTETGRKARSVSTTHQAIKPKQRSRIIDRANRRCERCGKPAEISMIGLQVGHVVSVKEGHRQGLDDSLINSDENLIAECDECNSGHGSGSLPIRLFVAILKQRENLSD